MRYEFGDTISSYVIEPGVVATGGRLAVLRGNAEVWFYNADAGGTRYTQLQDASLNPVNAIFTTNAAADLGYLPKFYGPEDVTFMWADANGGAGPRHRIEFNDEKLALAGPQTIVGDKTITGLILSTNTHSWEMPIEPVLANQVGAIQIRNDNTVTAVGSPDLFVIWYRGNTDTRRAGWFNEWGGLRIRVPPSTLLGYADVACKLFEPTTGGEDGLQVFGPSGAKKFYVRDGVIWGDTLNLTANAVVATAPTLGTHLTNKAYVDSLVVGGAPDATTTTKGIVQLAGDLSGTAASPTVPGLATKADESAVVHNTGAENVAGVKTFTSSPLVPTPTTDFQAATKAYADSVGGGTPPDATTVSKGIVQLAGDLDGTADAPTVPGLATKAENSDVVHNTGAENIAGIKTFASSPVVPTPVGGTDAATKAYVDSTAAGAFTPSSALPKASTMPAAAGASATYARGDHSHGSRQISPEHLGWIAWNFPGFTSPGATVLGTLTSAGTVVVSKVYIPDAVTVTNVIMHVLTAGSGLTAGQNFGGLYTNAGALLAQTVDQSTEWASTGLKEMTLSSPQAVSPGFHYVAVFYNGTTAPAFSRANTASSAANLGLTGSNALFATTSDTGRTTTMPATLGARTALTTSYFVAVS